MQNSLGVTDMRHSQLFFIYCSGASRKQGDTHLHSQCVHSKEKKKYNKQNVCLRHSRILSEAQSSSVFCPCYMLM